MKIILICPICGNSTQSSCIGNSQSVYLGSSGQYKQIIVQQFTLIQCHCVKFQIDQLNSQLADIRTMYQQSYGKKDDLIQQFQKSLQVIDQLVQRNKELSDTIQALKVR